DRRHLPLPHHGEAQADPSLGAGQVRAQDGAPEERGVGDVAPSARVPGPTVPASARRAAEIRRRSNGAAGRSAHRRPARQAARGALPRCAAATGPGFPTWINPTAPFSASAKAWVTNAYTPSPLAPFSKTVSKTAPPPAGTVYVCTCSITMSGLPPGSTRSNTAPTTWK